MKFASTTWVNSGRQSDKGFSYIPSVATQKCKKWMAVTIHNLFWGFSCGFIAIFQKNIPLEFETVQNHMVTLIINEIDVILFFIFYEWPWFQWFFII